MAEVSRTTRTRYATCGDVDIAYQVFGDGPTDLLVLPGPSIPIDTVDSEPSMYRFQRRLASFGRVIRYDQRGIGLSSRVPLDMIGPRFWAKDAIAVMNAVGCERATILAPGFTTMTALVLAADYPERVASLVLINGARPDDARARLPHRPRNRRHRSVHHGRDRAGRRRAGFRHADISRRPSHARDAFRAWWDMAGNRAASPSMARAIILAVRNSDVRDTLARISAPTLILHRDDRRFSPVEHGRYLAEHIAGSRWSNCPVKTPCTGSAMPLRCSTRSRSSSPGCEAVGTPNGC